MKSRTTTLQNQTRKVFVQHYKTKHEKQNNFSLQNQTRKAEQQHYKTALF